MFPIPTTTAMEDRLGTITYHTSSPRKSTILSLVLPIWKRRVDIQDDDKIDQISNAIQGLGNLHKGESHGNECPDGIFVDENHITLCAMRFGDEKICSISSQSLLMPPGRPIVGHNINISSSAFTTQLWTWHKPSFPNPVPKGHIDNPDHFRNISICSSADKSNAATTIHVKNTLNMRSNDAFEDKWDTCPRYRFKESHLKFLGTFSDVRDQPGWIFPAAIKILVNVKQTEDADTCFGQVEGSEERGMFLCSAVELA